MVAFIIYLIGVLVIFVGCRLITEKHRAQDWLAGDRREKSWDEIGCALTWAVVSWGVIVIGIMFVLFDYVGPWIEKKYGERLNKIKLPKWL